MLRFRPVSRIIYRDFRPISDGIPSLKPSSPFHTLKSFSTAPAPFPSPMRRLFSRFLKFGSYAALAGFAATTYVTCAYNVYELADKTVRLREFTNRQLLRGFTNRPGYGTPDGYHYDGYHFLPLEGVEEGTEISPKSDLPVVVPLKFDSPFISRVMTVAGDTLISYLTIRAIIQEVVKDHFAPQPDKLLPDKHNCDSFTLVLDLKETLVHSDWWDEYKIGKQTFKRPGLDAFLDRINESGYEVVLYTEDLVIKVAPLLCDLKNGDQISPLTMRANTYQNDEYYRDLSKLNRDPSKVLYVSGHALENCLQPENCVAIKPWKKEADDTTLTDLLPFLEYVAYERPSDIRSVLASLKGDFNNFKKEKQT